MRGLGNQRTVQELAKFVRAQDPSVLFLAETWADEARLRKLCDELQFDEVWVVGRITRAGGLALLWKNSIDIDVVSASLNHIDAIINKDKEDAWRFTGVYGIPETSRKSETWDLLRGLNQKFSLPWICASDFNEILRGHEKLGGPPRREAEMQAFRDIVDECELVDLGYCGHKFTWRGKRSGGMVLERLDRAFANTAWLELNPATRVQHVRAHSSDHNPIIIKPEGITAGRNKPFRFEQMWLREADCGETVKATWGESLVDSTMPLVSQKIRNCGLRLSEWSRHSFGSIRRQLEEKTRDLIKAEWAAATGVDLDSVRAIQLEVNELLEKENLMWQQRARSLFLKSSDRNTRYFHNRASHRYRRNSIKGLKNSANEWCTSDSQVSEIVIRFYESLFSSSNPSDMHKVMEAVEPKVTADMNQELTKVFTREEVDLALKNMEPLTAPGPDGMPPIFFQSFWSVVGDDVTFAVLDCLNNCRIPPDLNHTFVTLIPKVKSPEFISEFRPISLCNVIYKLFSKVLANRLKKVLPYLVSENQSAFQAGKVITDNILMAFETLHYMKNHQSGKTGFMALKLDMSKAYDRVEWSFMKELLRKLGFHEKWVALMMECITTVSYSILINGEPSGTINPSRGIRQGDPLSPYLFILCTEGLHGLLNQAVVAGDIRGISICRNGPRLTHLFFTDDSLLFCRASIQECQNIQDILLTYEKASGQQLNRDKTTLFFGKNVHQSLQEVIISLLGVSEVKQYEKYLGLPSFVGRRKKASFQYIKKQV